MSKKFTRILGAALLFGALLAVWLLPGSLFPSRFSQHDVTLINQARLTTIAVGYLLTGIAAGFGIALLIWPFSSNRQIPDK